jgi:hypothetical protein
MTNLVVTGWILFAVMVLLAAFNARKKLSMLPLGRARTWLLAHMAGGLLALVLFWIHTGTVWPHGLYLKALAACFYLVSTSGIIGYLLQRIYPKQLTDTGFEIIYEKIPAEITTLREQAGTVVLACTKETGADTLARHYVETLDWYFRRPRFFISHLVGGRKARAWHRQQCATVQRYLDDKGRAFLDQLTRLAERKHDLDVHYALQTILKGWLLIHLPLAVATMTLAVWHVILVHVYAL